MADHVYVSGTPVATPFVLGGEIHNFSTEARWLGLLGCGGCPRRACQRVHEVVTDPEITQHLVAGR